jgi:hypothetical protein
LWAGVSGVTTGIYPINNLNVGIGTTIPNESYTLHLGTVGTSSTDLYVANASRFISTANFDGNVNVSGILSATDINFTGGQVNIGIITATTLNVGSGGTILTATTGIGIGTTSPSAELDVNGDARFRTYHEFAKTVTNSGANVTLDLNQAQTFLFTPTQNITTITLINAVPSSTTSFTLRVKQGSTPYTVAVDTFRTLGGDAIDVYWPGGVVPVVTNSASATDIFSFMTFDGGTSLYGVVGGQNFS